MQSITLFELNQRVKQTLQEGLAGQHWVVAEIASLQVNFTGHCYLDLVQKDGNTIVSKAKATIWANVYKSLSQEFQQATGENLNAGMHVLCCLTVHFHEVYGLSYNIVRIDPNYTMGQRAILRKQIIEKLEKEGLLDRNKALPFSVVPQSIAIISSPTAAGLEDFMNQLMGNEYGYSYQTKLFPAIMQGNVAVPSLIQALQQVEEVNDYFDCIVLIRGGGAQLDLDCYDSYDLAVEMAMSSLPILTGIGHQRDDTVADLVSWKKLKTPTAVATFLIDRLRSYEEQTLQLIHQISSLAQRRVLEERNQLKKMQISLGRITDQVVKMKEQQLFVLQERMRGVLRNILLRNVHILEISAQQLKKYDPSEMLKMGYTITTVNGKPLSPHTTPQEGDQLLTLSAQWQIKSTVQTTKKSNGRKSDL